MGQQPVGTKNVWNIQKDYRVLGTGTAGGWSGLGTRSSRAQVLDTVAQGLLQAHDDGHLDEQICHAATEMTLWGQHESQGWSLREEGKSGTGQ